MPFFADEKAFDAVSNVLEDQGTQKGYLQILSFITLSITAEIKVHSL